MQDKVTELYFETSSIKLSILVVFTAQFGTLNLSKVRQNANAVLKRFNKQKQINRVITLQQARPESCYGFNG